MTLFRLRFLMITTTLVLLAGSANAAVWGKVENGRVSILYADSPPADRGYKLYANSNRFIIRPGAYRDPKLRAQAFAEARPLPQPRHYGPAAMPSTYDSHILAAADETKVDPALIKAVISVESGYNPMARSPKGAMGLMQLMPQTAARYGVKNIRDPKENIHGGARYLRDLMAMFGNDLRLVLAAYNAGEEAVMKYGRRIPPFAETVAYVPRVLGQYKYAQAKATVASATRIGATATGE